MVRSVLAVVAAVLLIGFIDQTLERTLVAALANAPITDEAGYLAVRNRTGVLAMTVVTHAFASLLTGYVLGKLAGRNEVRHAIAAAVLATGSYAIAFASPNVLLPPVWVRVAIFAITPPALVAGAYVRGQAREIRAEQERRAE